MPRSTCSAAGCGPVRVVELAKPLTAAYTTPHRSFYRVVCCTAFQEAVRWSAEDIAQERVPLSRWHDAHRQEFRDRVAKL